MKWLDKIRNKRKARHQIDLIMQLNPAEMDMTEKERLRENLLAIGIGMDKDEHLYRSASTTGRRDLPTHTFEELIRQAAQQVEKNGLSDRMIKMPIEAIQDAGYNFEFEDDVAQTFIEDWWGQAGIGFQDDFFKGCRDFLQNGEWHIPVAANQIDGEVELGFIDPINIESIKTLPGNALIKDKIVMKENLAAGQQQKTFQIIRHGLDGRLAGDVLSFFINSPVNSTRGRSILKTVLDFATQYDDVIFSEAERMAILKAFVFHAHADNWTPEQQTAFRNTYFPGGIPPNPGTIITTSGPGAKFESVASNLQAVDTEKTLKFLRNHALGSVGYFGALFGFGEDINVATMREQMRPVIWMINAYNRAFIRVLAQMIKLKLQFAADVHRHTSAGTITESTNLRFKIKPNSVFPKDMVSNAAVMQQMTSALSLSMSDGLIGASTGRKIFAWTLNNIGFETSVQEIEKDAAQGQNETFGPAPQQTQQPQGGFARPSMSELMVQSKRKDTFESRLKASLESVENGNGKK